MTWWLWTIIGVVAWLLLMFFVWALVKAGADEDKKTGRS
jgi:heme/copper-type cytochrome/quinol oxidase subunit 2